MGDEKFDFSQFLASDDDLDLDAPALDPEETGEGADHPSATHGDFHARDPELLEEIRKNRENGD